MRCLSVLVVDDDAAFTCAAVKVLSRSGCEVQSAQTLKGALSALNSRLFDAVITDLSLVGTWGREGLEVARTAKSRSSSTRVILITAYCSEEISALLRLSGVDICLDKPVSLQQLQGMLAEPIVETGSRDSVEEPAELSCSASGMKLHDCVQALPQ